jgi:hypothetical protein
MATFVLRREDMFPPGTSVSAYPLANWPQAQRPPSGAPVGSAAATATVAAGGSATFTGLANDTDYVAYAASPHRYIRFRVAAAAGGGGGGGALVYTIPGALSVGAGVTPIQAPRDLELTAVALAAGVAPAGRAIIVDINKNGASIFTDQATRPTIPAGQTKSPVSAVAVSLAAGDVLIPDVDQTGAPNSAITFVGSTVPAESNAASISFARPAGSATGDLHLVWLQQFNTAFTTWTPPAGWTEITPPVSVAGNHENRRFWFRDDGSAGPWVFTLPSAPGWRAGFLATYRGVVATGSPVDVGSSVSPGFSDTLAIPSPGATTVDGGKELVVGAFDNSGRTVPADPAGLTRRFKTGSLYLADRDLGAPSDPGGTTVVVDTAGNHVGAILVLKPVAGGGQPGSSLTIALG